MLCAFKQKKCLHIVLEKMVYSSARHSNKDNSRVLAEKIHGFLIFHDAIYYFSYISTLYNIIYFQILLWVFCTELEKNLCDIIS